MPISVAHPSCPKSYHRSTETGMSHEEPHAWLVHACFCRCVGNSSTSSVQSRCPAWRRRTLVDHPRGLEREIRFSGKEHATGCLVDSPGGRILPYLDFAPL